MTVEPQTITVTTPTQTERLAQALKSGAEALKPKARKAAEKIAQAAQPTANHIRQRPHLYAAGALLLGMGIGLMMSKKARGAVGGAFHRSWDLASDQGGKAARRLRAKLH